MENWELARNRKIYEVMEKFSSNPSNSNRYFEEMIAVFDSELESAKQEERERIEKEYLNIEFNPKMKSVASVLVDVGNWEFIGIVAVTDYSWVAKFSRLSLHQNNNEQGGK